MKLTCNADREDRLDSDHNLGGVDIQNLPLERLEPGSKGLLDIYWRTGGLRLNGDYVLNLRITAAEIASLFFAAYGSCSLSKVLAVLSDAEGNFKHAASKVNRDRS